MIIQFMSDLHREFDRPSVVDPGGGFPVPEQRGDVLVLAGDIDVGTDGADWINSCAEVFPHVIYLFGNHEFYHNDIRLVRQDMGDLLNSNIHLLDPGYVDIEGVRFVGGTLWADMDSNAFHAMNDSRIIANGGRRLLLQEVKDMYEEQAEYIKDNLSSELTNVVTTHHAPSTHMCDLARYGEGYMNTGYATDGVLNYVRDNKEIALWISGHTHAVMDKEIEGVRCVSNCRGYSNYEEVVGFDPTLTIEV